MKNIRKAVFETNSSSSHSIHIDESTELFDTTLLPNESGVIVLTGGEFGWEWAKFNDAKTKANYAAVESSGVRRSMLEEVIMEQTGARQIMFAVSDSYIDHQSYGKLGAIATHSELKNFIFNPNCWLVTGNDNESSPSNMFDFPKVTVDGVEEIKYTWELSIHGCYDTPKFTRKPTIEKLKEALGDTLADARFNARGERCDDTSWGSATMYFEPCSFRLRLMLVDKFESKVVINESGTAVLALCSILLEKDVAKQFAVDKFYAIEFHEREKVVREVFEKDRNKYLIEIPFELKKIKKTKKTEK